MNLDKGNIRRLSVAAAQHVGNVLETDWFETNDKLTRAHITDNISSYLNELLRRKDIADYTVICDETNNPPVVVDNGNNIMVDVFIQPTRSVDIIHISTDPRMWQPAAGFDRGVVEETPDINKAFEYAMKVVEPK